MTGAGLGAAVSAQVLQATGQVLGAMDVLFRRRRSEVGRYVAAVVEQEMPHAPESRIAQLAQVERQREVEFQRRSRQRLAAELPLALQEADPSARKGRVDALIAREKRYLQQRTEAAATRVVAALEQDLLHEVSPEGAYWALSPLVREHTLDCIAMAGKFWPWEVLERWHPQLHNGCQCRLLGLQEAIRAGLMTGEQLPDPADAMIRAAGLMAEANRLMESLAPEELEGLVTELEDTRLQEARRRLPQRWAEGTVKGGEFKPKRGSDAGRKSLKQLSLGDLATRTDMGAVRRLTIRGQDREVPEGAHWEERIDGTRFTSPAGGTNVYRDGKLIGDGHPDLGGMPEPTADEPPTPTSAASPIPDYTGVKLALKGGSHAGGSTGAKVATDENGRKWLVKTYSGSQDRIATELLANAVYRAMGAAAADAGQMQVRSEEPDFTAIPDVDVGEPPLPKRKPGQRQSTGVIVRDPDGSVWVYEPKGHFGGYEHTFPKGGLEKGLTPQQNAHKELWEETGLHAQITGFVGDYEGTTSTSRYYLATRIGGEPHAPDATPFVKGGGETAEVKRLSPEEAEQKLNTSRDKAILKRVLELPVPDTAEPGSYPEAPTTTALTYPLVDGEVREQKYGKADSWGGPSRKLGDHFMTDALVGNWDFVGLTRDNVLWQTDPADPEGDPRPVRIDQGGTFQYRAQGAPKPYGPIPTEVWTMRSPKGQGFGTVQVSEAGMRDQAAAIGATMTDAKVDELVNAAPFADEQMQEEIRSALKARVQWMREFADGDQSLPRPLEGARARRELLDNQQSLDVFPEEHAALADFVEGEREAVNAHLRSGADKSKTTQDVRDMVGSLDELLKQTKLDDDVYAYMSYDLAKHPNQEELFGRNLVDKGYGSATFTPSRAPGAGVIRVTIPAGARALYVQGVDGMEDAPEDVQLLLPRGARIRVMGAENGRLEAVVIG